MHFHFQNKPRNCQSNIIAFSSFLEKNRSPSSLQGFEILERFQLTIDKLHFEIYLKTDNNRVLSNHSHEF